MVLLWAASKGMAQIIQLKEIKNEWSKVCRQLPEQKVMIAYQASVPEPVVFLEQPKEKSDPHDKTLEHHSKYIQ